MDVTLAEQGFVHKGIVYENIGQQPTISVLTRTTEFKSDGFASDQPVVGKRRFFGVRVPCLWRIDAEIADAAPVFQTTGIPINDPEDDGSLGLNGSLE